MAKPNRKGRSNERFIHINASVWTSPAWGQLSPVARLAYVELLWRRRPHNNGDIPLSVRELGDKLNVSKDTAGRGLQDLAAWGFVAMEKRGMLAGPDGKRRSARWRLTEFATETKGATRDFEKLEAEARKLEAEAREARATEKALKREGAPQGHHRRTSGTHKAHLRDALNGNGDNEPLIGANQGRTESFKAHHRDSSHITSVEGFSTVAASAVGRPVLSLPASDQTSSLAIPSPPPAAGRPTQARKREHS